MSAWTIRARGRVPVAAPALFARLCDLDAHRDLAAPHIEVVRLHGARGARTGGDVVLHGPLGVRLRARTQVLSAAFPRELHGTATTTRGTTATLCWRLDPAGDATDVVAVLTVAPHGGVHRLLLAAGGTLWLRRRLATAIGRLAALPAPPPAARLRSARMERSDDPRSRLVA